MYCVDNKWFVCLFALCLKVMCTVSTTAHVLEVSAIALPGLKGATVSRVSVYMYIRIYTLCMLSRVGRHLSCSQLLDTVLNTLNVRAV